MLHLEFVLDSTALILLVNKGQQNPGRRQLLYLKLSIDWQINANSHFALCCFSPSTLFLSSHRVIILLPTVVLIS